MEVSNSGKVRVREDHPTDPFGEDRSPIIAGSKALSCLATFILSEVDFSFFCTYSTPGTDTKVSDKDFLKFNRWIAEMLGSHPSGKACRAACAVFDPLIRKDRLQEVEEERLRSIVMGFYELSIISCGKKPVEDQCLHILSCARCLAKGNMFYPFEKERSSLSIEAFCDLALIVKNKSPDNLIRVLKTFHWLGIRGCLKDLPKETQKKLFKITCDSARLLEREKLDQARYSYVLQCVYTIILPLERSVGKEIDWNNLVVSVRTLSTICDQEKPNQTPPPVAYYSSALSCLTLLLYKGGPEVPVQQNEKWVLRGLFTLIDKLTPMVCAGESCTPLFNIVVCFHTISARFHSKEFPGEYRKSLPKNVLHLISTLTGGTFDAQLDEKRCLRLLKVLHQLDSNPIGFEKEQDPSLKEVVGRVLSILGSKRTEMFEVVPSFLRDWIKVLDIDQDFEGQSEST